MARLAQERCNVASNDFADRINQAAVDIQTCQFAAAQALYAPRMDYEGEEYRAAQLRAAEIREALNAAILGAIDSAWRGMQERAVQAVIGVANTIPTDASEGWYLGYKDAIRNVLAAIRALS